MMMRTYGLGADVIQYYVTPSPEQQAYLTSVGKTWEVIAPRAGETVNEQGFVTSASPTIPTLGPWPTGQDIPVPPKPNYENCDPRDSACVARNLAAEGKWGDLLTLYNRALNEAYNPGAGATYQAALQQWTGAAGGAAGATAYAGTLQPIGTTPRPATPTPTVQPVQPTVSTGGQAAPVPPQQTKESTSVISGVPNWALLAAALGAGVFLLGGRR